MRKFPTEPEPAAGRPVVLLQSSTGPSVSAQQLRLFCPGRIRLDTPLHLIPGFQLDRSKTGMQFGALRIERFILQGIDQTLPERGHKIPAAGAEQVDGQGRQLLLQVIQTSSGVRNGKRQVFRRFHQQFQITDLTVARIGIEQAFEQAAGLGSVPFLQRRANTIHQGDAGGIHEQVQLGDFG